MPKTKPQNYPSGRLLRSSGLLNLTEEQDQQFNNYHPVTFNSVSVEDLTTVENQETEETQEIQENHIIENVNQGIQENHIIENVNQEIYNSDEMASGLHLQKFNGKESPSLWWTQLTSWQAFSGHTDEKIFNGLGVMFEGPALAWFRNLPAEDKVSLDTVKTALIKRFGVSRSFYSVKLEQSPMESPEDFLTRAEQVLMDDTELPEKHKVEKIVYGLLPQYQEKVIHHEPKTYNELRRAITLSVAGLQCNAARSGSINSVESTVSSLVTELKDALQAVQALHHREPQQQRRYYEDQGPHIWILADSNGPQNGTQVCIRDTYWSVSVETYALWPGECPSEFSIADDPSATWS